MKTYGIRGTVHLLPARKLGLWLAALRAVARLDPRRLAYLGITSEQMRSLVDAIGAALDGRRLTREELGAQVARRVGRWATERSVSAFGGRWAVWESALGAAAREGLLCFGPSEGTRVTFTRPEQWLGPISKIDPSEALREVLRRYLVAYGPATHREFAQWFAMEAAAAGDLVRSLDGEIEEVEIEGTKA